MYSGGSSAKESETKDFINIVAISRIGTSWSSRLETVRKVLERPFEIGFCFS